MCGIAGIVKSDGAPVFLEELKTLGRSLSHRGPDGDGVFLSNAKNVGLVHRRLAILDLSEAGSQPMSDSQGRYTITYNGEIYNFIELRDELSKKGYSFQTSTDTEVLLACFLEWGKNCLSRLNGMFAFAIFDEKNQSLFLARDRFGIKPLYVYEKGELFSFSSELKGFLSLSDFKLDLDAKVVGQAIIHQRTVESLNRTYIKNVKPIKPGTWVEFSCRTRITQTGKWWKLGDEINRADSSLSYNDQIEKFRDLFADSCRIRLRSDVPVATCLSGGLDSSSIVCVIDSVLRNQNYDKQRVLGDKVSAFVATFPGDPNDERKYAEEVIQKTGRPVIYESISQDSIISNLDAALYHMEYPHRNAPIYWLLYRTLKKNGFSVSIDGHGGDEVLGGYKELLYPTLFRNPLSFLEIFKSIKALNGSKVQKLESFLKIASVEEIQFHPKLLKLIEKIRPHKKQSWFHSSFPESPLGEVAIDKDDYKQFNRFNQILYYYINFITLPTILRNFDRCSMAHGVEIRTPFLDYRLVSFAMALPLSSKVQNSVTKRLLRDSMKNILPSSIQARPRKQGFGLPVKHWISGKFQDYFFDQLSSRTFQESDFWNGKVILSDFEKNIKTKKYAIASQTWEFILMHRLLEQLKSH